jgi:tRNA(Met) cytidine acetyltransferase
MDIAYTDSRDHLEQNRYSVNVYKQLSQWFESRHSAISHRQLLVIHGPKAWAIEQILLLLQQTSKNNILWVGKSPVGFVGIEVKDYRTILGQEFEHLVFDCFSGFRANAALALMGSVKAHGLMIILCPPLGQWPYYDDPESINRISFGHDQGQLISHFIQHLCIQINHDPKVARLNPDSFHASVMPVETNLIKSVLSQQQSAVIKICKMVAGRANRPLVLTADRGRGKSSALGIAAAQLMKHTAINIWVTAPQISSTQQIFIHARRMLPDHLAINHGLAYNGGSLHFVPVDKLFEDIQPADVLMVDEAAALPVHLLLRLVKRFKRIVFSSTIDGYEGSGRGFEIRFKAHLQNLRPNFQSIHLTQPLRWYPGDPLESFWFKTMMYQDSLPPSHIASREQPLDYRLISQIQLLQQPSLLAAVFGLLTRAHYQTSPDDLQRLLDQPEALCFLVMSGQQLIGVAQVVSEGGSILQELSVDIAACNRRVKGHLAAQSIAALYNQPQFCLSPQWRISRIAICGTMQRANIGSQLLSYIAQQAKLNGISILTAAFGSAPDLLDFWHKGRFKVIKLSTKPEISSGEYSCICVKALTLEVQGMLTSLTETFYLDLLSELDKSFSQAPTDSILSIIKSQGDTLCVIDTQLITQYCSGKRPFMSCKRVLKQSIALQPARLERLEQGSQQFVIGLLFQNQSYTCLSARYLLTGKKQIEQKLKTCISRMFL